MKHFVSWATLFFLPFIAEAQPQASFALAEPVTGEIQVQLGDIHALSTPWCSFNIALSVIGFEEGTLSSTETPQWTPGPEEQISRPVCEGLHTPASWMRHSVVWYSKQLVDQLGPEKLFQNLSDLDYGQGQADIASCRHLNQYCWLGQGLTVSVSQQLSFVSQVASETLPVSDKALADTHEILYRKPLQHDWQLYGKTGYGHQSDLVESPFYTGWFVGWIERDSERFSFAANVRDLMPEDGFMAAYDVALEQLNTWIEEKG